MKYHFRAPLINTELLIGCYRRVGIHDSVNALLHFDSQQSKSPFHFELVILAQIISLEEVC